MSIWFSKPYTIRPNRTLASNNKHETLVGREPYPDQGPREETDLSHNMHRKEQHSPPPSPHQPPQRTYSFQEHIASNEVQDEVSTNEGGALPSINSGMSRHSTSSSFARFQERFRLQLHRSERRAKIVAKVKGLAHHARRNSAPEQTIEYIHNDTDSATLGSVNSCRSPQRTQTHPATTPSREPRRRARHRRGTDTVTCASETADTTENWGSTATAVSEYDPDKIKGILQGMSTCAKRSPPRIMWKKRDKIKMKLVHWRGKMKRAWYSQY